MDLFILIAVEPSTSSGEQTAPTTLDQINGFDLFNLFFDKIYRIFWIFLFFVS